MHIPFFPLLLASLSAFAQTSPGGAPPMPRFSDPVLTSRIQPEYSPEARAANLEGIVTLYLEVDPQGKPDNVQVIQGLGLGLDERAADAVKRWQFEPAVLNGAPLRTAQSAEIRFHLDPAGRWRIRHTAYTVFREDNYHSEPIVKPVLTTYTGPDPGVCTVGEALVTVRMRIGKNGVPADVQIPEATDDATGKAVLDAAGTWKFQHASGADEPRVANAAFLLECHSAASSETTEPTTQVGRGVSAPSLISKTEPEYSEAARKIKYQGTVVLNVEVDPAGIATNLKIFRMLGNGLDAKAMEAVKQWRFKPGFKDGRPVTVTANIEVNFRLL